MNIKQNNNNNVCVCVGVSLQGNIVSCRLPRDFVFFGNFLLTGMFLLQEEYHFQIGPQLGSCLAVNFAPTKCQKCLVWGLTCL